MFTSLYSQLEDYILNTFHSNACMPWWGGSFLPKGYGQVWKDGTMRKVHQVALELYTGQSLGNNQVVLHSCDNASCVNPRHLSYGTYKENSRQARDRNRMTQQKLDWNAVKFIREQVRTKSTSQKDLAKQFEVSAQTINDIVKGRIWQEPSKAHIDEIVTDSNGASQSKLLLDVDLLPFHAIFELMACLTEGASKYTVGNWRKLPIEDHLSHALMHLLALKAGNFTEDHMQHAATRLMMALELKEAEKQNENHCKEIELPEEENYCVSATSPSDPALTKKLMDLFGVKEDPAPPMTMGDFFGQENDIEYPIIQTEDKVMNVGLGDK